MQWIKNFDTFLFDFDGLLVDTESLHYKAYQQACAERGFDLDWDMHEYGRAAYFHASGLKDALVAKFGIKDWDAFYAKKRDVFMELVDDVVLMPDVKELLGKLAGKQMCVVTHSTREMVERVRRGLPELDCIKEWITRDDYTNPKPAPDGYNLAIEKFGGRVIGFEDTPKGLKALVGTKRAKAVLVSPFEYLYKECKGAVCVPRLSALEEALVS